MGAGAAAAPVARSDGAVNCLRLVMDFGREVPGVPVGNVVRSEWLSQVALPVCLPGRDRPAQEGQL